MIGSLLRVCSETYKQSNRNDNKTNNKDTQPRFEQDSTRSYSVRNDHSPSLIRSVHITHRFKKLYAKRKQAGRQALLDSCSASSERFGRHFQEHPLMSSPSEAWEIWQLRAVEKIVCIYSLSKGMELGQPRGCRGDCGSFMSQNKRTSHTFWLSF